MKRFSFFKTCVGNATADQLSLIRIFACGILLVSILWEDYASSALLPRGLLQPQVFGALQFLYSLPIGFEEFIANESALRFFEWFTTFALILGMIGFKTRWVLPVACVGYLVIAGINRQYSWFYHTGLIPLYVAMVLSFLPCADGLSLDRYLKFKRGEPVVPKGLLSPIYGWGRYACWSVIAMPYLVAGLSKISNGGFFWWHPTNMKSILFKDSLSPMAFDWGLSLHLAHAPDVFFAFLGLAALAGELSFILVLGQIS